MLSGLSMTGLGGRLWFALDGRTRDLRPGRPDLCGSRRPGVRPANLPTTLNTLAGGAASRSMLWRHLNSGIRWRTGDRVDVELGASTYENAPTPNIGDISRGRWTPGGGPLDEPGDSTPPAYVDGLALNSGTL